MNKAELGRIFARIPLLSDYPVSDFTIVPLAGLTNDTVRLWNDQFDWILRIPQVNTSRVIDRDNEAFNQAIAARLNIAPCVSWRGCDGITLTPTLTNSRCLRRTDFNNDEMLRSIVEPIRRLHRSEKVFRGRVNPGELLFAYFEMLTLDEQQRMRPRLCQAQQVLGLLENGDIDYVASHNDPVLENVLLDEHQLWLIDWEYSAMASPYWDLATLCNSARLDRDQSLRLLRIYCVGGLSMQESLLFDYRGLLGMLSDCWWSLFVKQTAR